MSIDEAINVYAALARNVFSEKELFFQEGTFKAYRLEGAIVSIVREKSNKADSLVVKMINQDEPKW